MKVAVTSWFVLAFVQVVLAKIQYGPRPIRQASEMADLGQLQQLPVASQALEIADPEQIQHPPVALQALEIPPDTASTAENLQPLEPAISSPNDPEQLPLSPSPSQTSSVPITSTPLNFAGQIPEPRRSQAPTTPYNPIVPSSETPLNSIDSSGTPTQAPAAVYPYNPAMFPVGPPVYPSLFSYANSMMNVNPQQFMYNPYYMQNPMAYTNAQQMMYAMPPNLMPYVPFLPPPPAALPFAMNYSQTLNNNLNSIPPQRLLNISPPYPIPPNYIPALNAPDPSATPTVISSTGESGTDLNSLPPQVKEFIDMIPQILTMHESTPEQNTRGGKRPTMPIRKLPKVPASSLLKKKQYYQSNYAPSQFTNYPQRYGYYY